MRARIGTALAVLLATGLFGAVTPSNAAPAPTAAVARTSSTHCTIVGTSHADRLVGTRHRDVICGLGGNDVIIGRGGDDVLRGGGGRDTLEGGAGDDVLKAGGGADDLVGGDGNDRLYGGSANDDLSAGAGRDLVAGGYGNDDLAGGANADDIQGGPGTNWCTLDAADTATRCVYDRTPGRADRLSVSTRAIDVTAAARLVTVRVHVTDDTGIEGVRVAPGPGGDEFISANATRRSGDVRDGWWEASLVFPRYSMPGTYEPRVVTWDRVGRRSDTDFVESSIQVRDDTPDLELPTVRLISPTPDATYDARTTDVSFKVKARIVDALSGTANDVQLMLWQPRVDGVLIAGWGDGMHLVSGTIHDGIWVATMRLPRGVVGGSWNVDISVTDRAHLTFAGRRLDWVGPGEYAYRSSDPENNRPFPDNMGSVDILGRARTDTTAPTVSSVAVSPATIDTLPGQADVHFTLHAADVGLGVQGVQVELVPLAEDPNAPMMPVGGVYLDSGTAKSGSYSGTMTVPQGIPPGTYYVKVLAWDVDWNFSTYVSSGVVNPGWNVQYLENNPTVTVVDSTG